MKVIKTDPTRIYHGVRFRLPSGRVAERYFEYEDDRTTFLDMNERFEVISFSSPEPARRLEPATV